MKYIKTSQKSAAPKKTLILSLLILIMAGAGFWLFSNKNASDKKTVIQPGSVADVSRPTEAEKQAADTQKDKNIAREQADNTKAPSPTNKKQVIPYITFIEQTGGNIEAGGIITGVYETSGTCTLTITNGTKQVTVQSEAKQNATTTDCTPFSIPEVRFSPKGTWTFVLSYSSPNAQGSSQTKDVNVK